jgi:predicted NUDIX family NTP pyrophosphohydrolase
MPRTSAGILGFRHASRLEVLLVHPGGPLWARRDAGAWTIPKGLVEPGETPEAAAVRELREETGWTVSGELLPLGTIRQKSGKVVHGFAAPLDVDPSTLVSNTFPLEWPPRSGLIARYPEVDRALWLGIAEAREKILDGQLPLLDRLSERLTLRG